MLTLPHQKWCISASTGQFLPIFDCSVSDDTCASEKICCFGCHLGAVYGSRVVFEFISDDLVILILHPLKQGISASGGLVSLGCCGLFWGGFWICFCCFRNADFASPKVMYLSFFGPILPIFWLFFIRCCCASQKICWFGCYLGAVNGTGAVFESVSVIFVMLILPP